MGSINTAWLDATQSTRDKVLEVHRGHLLRVLWVKLGSLDFIQKQAIIKSGFNNGVIYNQI